MKSRQPSNNAFEKVPTPAEHSVLADEKTTDCYALESKSSPFVRRRLFYFKLKPSLGIMF